MGNTQELMTLSRRFPNSFPVHLQCAKQNRMRLLREKVYIVLKMQKRAEMKITQSLSPIIGSAPTALPHHLWETPRVASWPQASMSTPILCTDQGRGDHCSPTPPA